MMYEGARAEAVKTALDSVGNLLISQPGVLKALETKGRNGDAEAGRDLPHPLPISINILPA